jgi:hydroxymethylglutaryl-CoA synthase
MTYQSRVKEAMANLKAKKVKKDPNALDTPILDQWARLVFHLPYAAHGRRMASELYMANLQEKGEWEAFAAANELEIPDKASFDNQAAYEKAYAQFLRGITKTAAYREFTQVKLQKAEDISSQVGNMYACSVFLALMGTLELDHLDNSDLAGQKMGCLAYGSGSKSKVFEVQVQPTWKEVAQNFKLTEKLAARQAIDYATYEQLHRLEAAESVAPPSGEFKLDKIGEEVDREGARYYSWVE